MFFFEEAEPVAEPAAEATTSAADQILARIIDIATDVGKKLIFALIVLLIGRLIIRWVMKLIRKGKLFGKLDTTVSRFLQSVIRILLNILLVLTIVNILGVPMTSMVAILASAGVTIGLALQGALSNLAGGIMLLIFRPFRVDDFIEYGAYSGTVEDIGIFYTLIKTPDNRNVTIPNGSITNATVVNYSQNDNRRLDLTFDAAYGTDVERVKAILLDEAAKNEMVLTDPAPFARLSSHESSSIRFVLRVWVKKEDYWDVNFNLIEAVHNRLEAEGIQIPFPQMDVHMISSKND